MVTCNWGVNSAQGVESILVEGSAEVIECERSHWGVQAVSGPLPPAQYEPGGGHTPPNPVQPERQVMFEDLSPDLSPEMALKVAVWPC